MAGQNYRVRVAAFGAYRRDAVLPEWAVARAGPVAELVARGVVEPVALPVNVDLRVPEPKTKADPDPAVVDEANRLAAENARLAADNRTLVDQAAALKEQVKARDKHLGKLTADVEHLTEACETHQARIAELEKELEQATAPAA